MGGHDGSWEVSLGRVVQGLLYCRATVARRGWRSWPVPCAALVLLSSCFLFGASRFLAFPSDRSLASPSRHNHDLLLIPGYCRYCLVLYCTVILTAVQ